MPEPGPVIGVVGGMGPLASAEFLRTVYRLSPPEAEQAAPRLLLWSDPAIADRTEAIERTGIEPVAEALARSVAQLLDAGAAKVVIACLTAHCALDHFPPELARHCVSLVDVVHQELAARGTRHLLLCTRGARRARIFTRHPRWPEVAGQVVFPGAGDQIRLHDLLYRLKRDQGRPDAIDFVRTALETYEATAFVAGCTELHLVTTAIEAAGLTAELPGLDPLTIAATRISRGIL